MRSRSQWLQELLDKGLARIQEAWSMLTGKGKITQEQVEEYQSRLHGTLGLADFADCDLIIEAVIENTAWQPVMTSILL